MGTYRKITDSDRMVTFRHKVAQVYDEAIIDRLRRVWAETATMKPKERGKFVYDQMTELFRGRRYLFGFNSRRRRI